MGRKNFRRKANRLLLEELRKNHWEKVVNPILKTDGSINKKHLLWVLSVSGCRYPFNSQLLDYMILTGDVQIIRSGSGWRILKATFPGKRWNPKKMSTSDAED